MPIRALIVDDHEAIRKGVRGMLEDEGVVQVIDEAVNGDEAIRKAENLRPDLIIMDVSMPVRNGLSAAAEIKSAHPEIRILMFSSYAMPDFVKVAKNMGLNGYVSKDDDGRGLLRAIEAVFDDKTYFPAGSPKT